MHSQYLFTFPHPQLAMKQHYHGPEHGISTESLSFTEVQISSDKEYEERIKTLVSVEARICRLKLASLCLRIQQWALISPTDHNWIDTCDMILCKARFMSISDHLRISDFSEMCSLIRDKMEAQSHGNNRVTRKCGTSG